MVLSSGIKRKSVTEISTTILALILIPRSWKVFYYYHTYMLDYLFYNNKVKNSKKYDNMRIVGCRLYNLDHLVPSMMQIINSF